MEIYAAKISATLSGPTTGDRSNAEINLRFVIDVGSDFDDLSSIICLTTNNQGRVRHWCHAMMKFVTVF